MKISYNWLKQYVKCDLSAEEAGKYLTDCGLEVEGLEEYETIKGGLKGLVVGEVLTCEPHPDSDHLHVTTVNVGGETPLNIVCGAPNVAQGQKVIVATIGTVLYNGDESFTIKKSKLRGVVSEGMICAEDEIGVGTSHDGIMVLPPETKVGTPAAKLFKVESDWIFEIGLTPNRSDAICHYGVARDLHAALEVNHIPCSALMLPNDFDFNVNSRSFPIDISIENPKACPRYTGLTLENVTVKESPEWLQNRLKSIGVRPINNVVDVTQYIMFEIGQPMHAFDADKIQGGKIIVKNLPEGTPFTTLDGNEIKLSQDDLMICDTKGGLCIGGVYGGLNSGVSDNTKRLFLESAYFNPVSIRKTAKRHGLKTDASFRFERGCDPDICIYALKRAAIMIRELTGGIITSDIVDIYPTEIAHPRIPLRYDEINKVAGKKIDKHVVNHILMLLGMEVQASGEEQLLVSVPLYRVDVTRPIDLIEEILRIYGYNNIEIPSILSYPMNNIESHSTRKLQKKISTYLADAGFFEVMNNSLTKAEYAQKFDFINEAETINLMNPLSSELGVLRQTLLFSGLENIARNLNNKQNSLRLFEFGKTYHLNPESAKDAPVTERYLEKEYLTLFATGKTYEDIWNFTAKDLDMFYLKNIVNNILIKANVDFDKLEVSTEESNDIFNQIVCHVNGELLGRIGQVQPHILKYFGIKKAVYYAELNTQLLFDVCKTEVNYKPIPAFPEVKRDLALIIDKNISYETLKQIGFKYGSKLLKNITLFDVYEGEKIEEGKKSYALNFILQHPEKTLTEEEINKVMNKLIAAYEREAGAKLRN